jgi:hypothetical protein
VIERSSVQYAQSGDVHVAYEIVGGGDTEPSEILVSSTVKDLVAGSGIEFEPRGEHELKCVPDRWHLFAVMG